MKTSADDSSSPMDEPRWSRRYDICVNCRSNRRPHAGRGYCSRCYPLLLRIEQAKRWTLDDRRSLRGFPSGPGWPIDSWAFTAIQTGVLRQLLDRLDLFRIWEDHRAGRVNDLDVEYQLSRLALAARTKTGWNLFHGVCHALRSDFSKKQITILYRLLNDIEEDIPWRGVDLARCYDEARAAEDPQEKRAKSERALERMIERLDSSA